MYILYKCSLQSSDDQGDQKKVLVAANLLIFYMHFWNYLAAKADLMVVAVLQQQNFGGFAKC